MVISISYFFFNFLNLNAGWIHRIDNSHVHRPWKAPTWLLGLGSIFAFVNVVFMGAGAESWNPNALIAGLIFAACIIPVFWFRHYIQDGGKFPEHMLADLGMTEGEIAVKKAGMLPYLTLLAGFVLLLVADYAFGSSFLGFVGVKLFGIGG